MCCKWRACSSRSCAPNLRSRSASKSASSALCLASSLCISGSRPRTVCSLILRVFSSTHFSCFNLLLVSCRLLSRRISELCLCSWPFRASAYFLSPLASSSFSASQRSAKAFLSSISYERLLGHQSTFNIMHSGRAPSRWLKCRILYIQVSNERHGVWQWYQRSLIFRLTFVSFMFINLSDSPQGIFIPHKLIVLCVRTFWPSI